MAQITSGVGLISGINTSQIIDELISIDSQPVTQLQTRITNAQAQQDAYNSLLTQLQQLQTIGQALERPTTFLATTSTSSDPSILTATTGPGAPQGTYQFEVAQLVSSQQSISNGYASSTSPVQAGTLTLEMGGGNLNPQTTLAALNGGAGVSRGQFRITDRSGHSDVINTTSAINLDDVVNQINNALDISVHASIQNDHLVLTDNSGGSGSLNVQDLGSGTSAKDLGIAGSAAGNTLTGSIINDLGSQTALSSLNDGLGIRTTSGTGDFTVTVSDGSKITVNLGAAQTIGDVINAINTAGGSKLKASLAPGAKGLTLTDTSGGGGSFSVSDINGSHAAEDLGIQQTGSGGVINGDTILAGIDSVLVKDLKGGSGIALGSISVTDRSGATATVNLSAAKSVQDILDAINNTSGVHVTASLNSAGTGIQIQDASGGTGNLVIGDSGGGNTAESLGIAGTFGTNQGVVDGGNLQLQWVSQNTLLSSYNGGKGVNPGSFTITNAAGSSATVTVTQSGFTRVGDVINAINAKGLGVTASIDANGNGILLTDNSVGHGHLSVANVTGTTASDLNIAGTASANTIDGSLEKTIQVTSTDTLATVQGKIQSLGFGVAANIINDGSSNSPARLSLTAFNSGVSGRVIIDGGSTGLQFRNLVQAQDAAVFVGGNGSAQPLLVTSHSNQLTGILPGVTINLQSASSNPVTLNITNDPSGITTQLQQFVTTFNATIKQLGTLTTFDTTTNTAGILLGDPTAQTIQQELYSVFDSVVKGAGNLSTVADVGLTLDDNSNAQFDSSKFAAAFAQNPTAVQTLFTQATTGLGAIIDQSMTSLVDPVSGSVTEENQTLTNRVQQFQDQITQLDQVLADKRSLLEQQFANMESVLAGLQSQQSILSSFNTLEASLAKPASTSSSSSSSGSGSSSSSSTGG